jgi:hypothetical protein
MYQTRRPMKTEMIPLYKIRDNPWRDRMRNPIDPDRVEAIGTSIDKTGKYWLGTYGREVKDGFVELAFGHHRLEAAKSKGLKEIPITLAPFTDGEMLVWMAQENVRGELPVVLEAVSAAVRALGEGKIEIEAPGEDTPKKYTRYAPSFISGNTPVTTVVTRPYTSESLAKYLGYVKKSSGTAKNSVVAAMGILERAEIASLEGGKEGAKKAAEVEKELSSLKVNDAIKKISDLKLNDASKNKEQAEKAIKEIREQEAKNIAFKKLMAEREANAKKERNELLRKQVEASLAENAEKTKKIAQKIKEKAEAAEAKAEEDKAKMAALDTALEAKKAAAEEQRKVDAYAPVRRETERIIHILERRDLSEDLKALSRKPLTLKDRDRVWQAITNLSDWLSGWAAAQFTEAPIPNQRRSK